MDILAQGTYRAKAIEAALGETSTGKEQVAVKFQLLDVEGQSLVWYGYFTEKTTDSTFKALRVAGWKGSDLTDLSDLSKDTPEVHLVVEHETDDKGTTRARVRWVNSTGGMGIKNVLPADKAKAFAASMRARIAAFDQAQKAAGVQAPAPRAKQANDIPF